VQFLTTKSLQIVQNDEHGNCSKGLSGSRNLAEEKTQGHR